MKVSAYFALEKEGVGNFIKSLCTNSRGVGGLMFFPLGKGSWCSFQRVQPENNT